MLSSALNVLSDVTDGNKSFESALLDRSSEGFKNLKRKAVAKMRGDGAKRLATSQSISKPRKNQTSKKRSSAKGKKKPVKKKKPSAAKKKNTKKQTSRTKSDLNLHQFF